MDAKDLKSAQWRTSSYSSGNGQCVEVAVAPGWGMAIRDSKDPAGPALVVPAEAWTAFVEAVTAGELDAAT